jgi:DNA-binding transcriptional ArsR family regulator
MESTGGTITASIGEDRLSETFAVLANSTRRAILARLAQGEATVNELAKPFDLTLPAVSKHIKVLVDAGLVVRGHRAQHWPCAIDATPLRAVLSWTERYRPIWESRFDRMNDYLMQLGRQQEAGKQDD